MLHLQDLVVPHPQDQVALLLQDQVVPHPQDQVALLLQDLVAPLLQDQVVLLLVLIKPICCYIYYLTIQLWPFCKALTFFFRYCNFFPFGWTSGHTMMIIIIILIYTQYLNRFIPFLKIFSYFSLSVKMVIRQV